MASVAHYLSAPERNARKLICKHGHPLTGDNVRVELVGVNKDRKQRVCLACKKERDKKKRIERREYRKQHAPKIAIVRCVWDSEASQYVPADSHRGVHIRKGDITSP